MYSSQKFTRPDASKITYFENVSFYKFPIPAQQKHVCCFGDIIQTYYDENTHTMIIIKKCQHCNRTLKMTYRNKTYEEYYKFAFQHFLEVHSAKKCS